MEGFWRLIMSRYSKQSFLRNFKGRRVYTTTRYPEIPKQISDIYVIAQDSDRLDILASQYYNNHTLWWIIAQANNVGKGTLRLIPGQQLRIPIDIDSILREYKRINNAI